LKPNNLTGISNNSRDSIQWGEWSSAAWDVSVKTWKHLNTFFRICMKLTHTWSYVFIYYYISIQLYIWNKFRWLSILL
jgi:hypothetical protein